MTGIYTVENSNRRSDVEESMGYYKIYFGRDGEWLSIYRVTGTLEKAKIFADDWVSGKSDGPDIAEGCSQ